MGRFFWRRIRFSYILVLTVDLFCLPIEIYRILTHWSLTKQTITKAQRFNLFISQLSILIWVHLEINNYWLNIDF